MKRLCYVSFNIPREKGAAVYRVLAEMGCADGWHEAPTPNGLPSFQQTFDIEDPRFLALIRMLREEDLTWFERHEHVYTEYELKSALFLRLGVARKSIDGGGPELGTEYDLSNACPQCGTGALQTSALMLPLAELPKTGLVCETHRGHFLVAERLADSLRTGGVSGLELRQVHFYRNDEPLPWWQVISTHTMPRMSPQTKGIVRDTDSGWACPVCERDMYCGTPENPTEIAYNGQRVDPDSLPDVVQTWECFGRSVLHDDPERHLQRGFALPQILVKPKVMHILRALKVKHVRFQPVHFVS